MICNEGWQGSDGSGVLYLCQFFALEVGDVRFACVGVHHYIKKAGLGFRNYILPEVKGWVLRVIMRDTMVMNWAAGVCTA